MNSCRECGKTMESARETYHFKECGLPNVYLQGVEVERCRNGHRRLLVPNLAGLHRAIALAIIAQKRLLAGREIRFLRKHLGWSGQDFARRMGLTNSQVSRWENDHEAIGAQSDRLLRMLVLVRKPVESYEPYVEMLPMIRKTPPKKLTALHLENKGGEWRRAA